MHYILYALCTVLIGGIVAVNAWYYKFRDTDHAPPQDDDHWIDSAW